MASEKNEHPYKDLFDGNGALFCGKWKIKDVGEAGMASDGATDHPTGALIEGYWCEDGTPFYIKCPPQLASRIIALQNKLAEEYPAYDQWEKL